MLVDRRLYAGECVKLYGGRFYNLRKEIDVKKVSCWSILSFMKEGRCKKEMSELSYIFLAFRHIELQVEGTILLLSISLSGTHVRIGVHARDAFCTR